MLNLHENAFPSFTLVSARHAERRPTPEMCWRKKKSRGTPPADQEVTAKEDELEEKTAPDEQPKPRVLSGPAF